MIKVEVFPFIITPLGVWQVAEELSFEPLHCRVSDMDPMDRAGRLVRDHLDVSPALVHGTSWRYDDGDTIVLTFAAVLPRGANVAHLHAQPCMSGRALVYGGPLSPPAHIEREQVRDHALRHLAFLVQVDPEVERILTPMSSVLAWEPDVAQFFVRSRRIAA